MLSKNLQAATTWWASACCKILINNNDHTYNWPAFTINNAVICDKFALVTMSEINTDTAASGVFRQLLVFGRSWWDKMLLYPLSLHLKIEVWVTFHNQRGLPFNQLFLKMLWKTRTLSLTGSSRRPAHSVLLSSIYF